MFKLLGNLTKAAIGVAVAPVAIVVDVVKLPADAFDGKDAFNRTGNILGDVGKNVKEAIEP
jgi:hypothetical protein